MSFKIPWNVFTFINIHLNVFQFECNKDYFFSVIKLFIKNCLNITQYIIITLMLLLKLFNPIFGYYSIVKLVKSHTLCWYFFYCSWLFFKAIIFRNLPLQRLNSNVRTVCTLTKKLEVIPFVINNAMGQLPDSSWGYTSLSFSQTPHVCVTEVIWVSTSY